MAPQPWWGSFAGAFALVTLKASLLLLLAGVASALLTRGSAAARHLIWSLAVGGAVVLPVVTASLPWSWHVLPAFHARTLGAPRGASSLVLEEAPRQTLAGPDLVSDAVAEQPSSGDARVPSGSDPSSVAARTSGASDAEVAPLASLPMPSARVDVAAAARPATSPPSARVPLDRLAGVFWGAVAAFLLLHQMFGLLTLAGLTRTSEPVTEPATLRMLARLSGALGIRRTVELRRSARVRVPMTWGAARPVILLPDSSWDWSQERTRVVLKHELAHVRRLDAFALSLGRLGTALYWFNPLMWWALHRLRIEGERAADDCVLHQGERASDYAGHLLDLVTQIGRPRTHAGALPLAEPSRLEDRLVAILEPDIERSGVRRTTAFVATASAVAAVLLLSAAAPARAGTADSPDSPTDRGAPSAATEAHSAVRATVRDAAEVGASNVETPARATPPADHAPTSTSGAPSADETPATEAGTVTLPLELRTSPTQAAPPQVVVQPQRRNAQLQQEQDARAVQALIGALRSDENAEVRRTAAWSLGQMEDTAATAALGQALAAESSVEVRRVIVWAIGQIEDPAGVPALGAALRDTDLEVRRSAVWALGQIEAPGTESVLSEALSDADPEVRSTAAWALGQIATAATVAPLAAAVRDPAPEVREQAVWALGQVRSPEVVPALSQALADTTVAVRRQAAWALGMSRSVGAVPTLANALRQDADAEVREQAAWALGQIDSPEGVPALAAALSDPSPQVGAVAAWALGRISPEAAPQELVAAATNGTGELRSTALWALAEIGDEAALPALVAALKDADAEIRAQALNGLVELGDAGAIEAIAELLKDPDPQVRAAAARALSGGRASGFSDPRPRPQPQPQPRPRPPATPRPVGG